MDLSVPSNLICENSVVSENSKDADLNSQIF